MQCMLVCVVLVQLLVSGESLSFNPDDYLEVYPDPRDPEVLQGRTPLYFALIMNLGGPFSQFDGSGTVAGAKVALDRINNDSSLLPGYTLHFTVANSMCNRTESLIALYSQLLREPKKLAIVGSGCSVATEPAAEISHFYNITQISCVSSSPELRSRLRFPRYFQLLATDEILAYGFYGVIKEYGWRRVALIVQDENLFTVTMNRLKMQLDQNGVDYNEKRFNSTAGAAGLLPDDPFDEGSRIFVLSMYPRNAVFLLCEAYRRGYRAPQYMMLTQSSLGTLWRMVLGPGLCSIEERASVLASTLAVISIFALDEVKDANRTTTSGITGKEFLSKERNFLGRPPLNVTFFPVSQYCHDAVWTLAYALNQTYYSLNDSEVNEEVSQGFNVTPPFRLEDFTYSSDKLMELMFDHLRDTTFDGITGPVNFGEDGLRNLSTLLITQYRQITNEADGGSTLEMVDIGNVILENTEFVYLEGEDIDTVWTDGLITYDGVARKEVVTVHPAITSIYTILASAGIILALTCLIFNFIYRNTK